MKKKNYSIILCGGLFLASCMSNNDKCLQKLFDEVGVEKSQIHNATHLVTILGNGCKGCIHKALSEIHNSTDTIYIIACKSKKTFNLIDKFYDWKLNLCHTIFNVLQPLEDLLLLCAEAWNCNATTF